MSEQFLGCTVSIEATGGLGFYQGLVTGINAGKQLISLSKVLHNGKPMQIPEVSLRAKDIVDLSILHTREELQQNESTILKKQNLVPASQTENESFSPKVKNLSKTSGAFHIASPRKYNDFNAGKEETQEFKFKPVQCSFSGTNNLKKKPRTSVGETLAHGSIHSTGSEFNNYYGNQTNDFNFQRRNQENCRTPNRKQIRKNYRDESTFGITIDDNVMDTEFDFEKNLALFDKQAVMEEIQSLRPDVIKQAVGKSEKQYRCDENIIAGKPVSQRQIIVPSASAGEMLYVTDNGLLVPSISIELRVNLLTTANQHGLTKSRQLEMIGRGATEIILSVIGGSHRLEPGNSHQPPVVVILCGAHMQGAAGTNCARQLDSQGVQTVVITPRLSVSPPPSLLLSQETQLYSLTDGNLIVDANALPVTVDLIVDARFDLEGHLGVDSSSWVAATDTWALASRAPILCLDGPPLFTSALTPRIRLCPSLPLAYPPEKGKVYLLNLNIPGKIYSSLGIKYTSPFGAKLVVPLHPCE